MNVPCRGCTERCAQPNCHTYCDKYKAFEEQCARIRQLRQDEKSYAIAKSNAIAYANERYHAAEQSKRMRGKISSRREWGRRK